MYDYNTLCDEFIQYKLFLGYKYKTDNIVINEIKGYLIQNNISVITMEVTENYARINENLSSNTIARNMGVFREFCHFLKYQKGIDCYQIPKKLYPQNHNNYIPYVFTKNEIKLIYSNMDKPLCNYHYAYYNQNAYPLIIKILYQTGMRIGEVLNLKLEDYKRDISVFEVKNTKNLEDRYVAFDEYLNKQIADFCDKFFDNISESENIFKVSKSAVAKYFKKVLILSDIKINDNGPRIHDLRHTFVVHRVEKAMENKEDFNTILPILQSQLGHKSLDSLSYYFHITKDVLGTINNISEQELGYLIRENKTNE